MCLCFDIVSFIILYYVEANTKCFSFVWVRMNKCGLTCPGPVFCQYINAVLDDLNVRI